MPGAKKPKIARTESGKSKNAGETLRRVYASFTYVPLNLFPDARFDERLSLVPRTATGTVN